MLVAALAAGATHKDAADQAGVSERTVRRRLDDPAFRRQVDDARAEMLTQAVAMLTHASVKAVRTLEELLASPIDFARLAAARAILEIGTKLRDQLDLSERLTALEQKLEHAQRSQGRGAA